MDFIYLNFVIFTVMGPTTSASLSLSNLKLKDLNNSASAEKPNAETSAETNYADSCAETEGIFFILAQKNLI
jgi:hypothetical protein